MTAAASLAAKPDRGGCLTEGARRHWHRQRARTSVGFGLSAYLYGALPIGVAAAFALVVAWWLWHGRRHAPLLALLCTSAAGLLTWSLISPGFNNVLWAAGVVLREPETWFVRWPTFYFAGTVERFAPMPGAEHQLPYGQLDDLFFWIPGVLAVGSILIVVLLAAGWLTSKTPMSRGREA